MASQETEISNKIRLAAHRANMVLLRNNRGMFLTLDGTRKVQAGLSAKGSSDLIGWREVVVTPDMVGNTVAIFTCIEVKTETGRCSPEQIKFLDNVRSAGGIAEVIRSEKAFVTRFVTF